MNKIETNIELKNSLTLASKSRQEKNGTDQEDKGILYVVGTPIGNLSDFTFWALEVLKLVNWIVCEDSRETLKLLHRYGIEKKLLPIPAPIEFSVGEGRSPLCRLGFDPSLPEILPLSFSSVSKG